MPRNNASTTNANTNTRSSSQQNQGNTWVPPSNNHYYKAYGGQRNFMIAFGLKPYDPDAYDEARRLVEMFREDDRLEWEAKNQGK
ncbi:hypothetical protein AN958_03606 [Leucoagaricus sp. SymC.cos]|nr:hypothetical protein AN958_03606 [Leucoagaricus sp. SymC.cos]